MELQRSPTMLSPGGIDSDCPSSRDDDIVQLIAAPERYPAGWAETLLGQRVGRYVIERCIGEGGMSVVFVASDAIIGRRVALKFLAGMQASPTQLRVWFEREARASGQMDHENVARLYDVGEFEGRLYLAMEYVDGETLRDVLRAATVERRRALRIMRAICEATSAIHDAGLVHRDLKPENVMIGKNDRVKVLDLGLAKWSRPTELFPAPASIAAAVGTPGYMAPEQIRGEGVDAKADIFALGVILFELLFGRHPFAAGALGELLAATLAGLADVPPLTGDAAPALRKLLLEALAPAASNRLASARAMSERLADILDPGGAPALAPDSAVRPKMNGSDRNAVVALDGAACVAARLRRGLRRDELAEASAGNLSVPTIIRVEKGLPVYLDTARRLANLLDVALDDLVAGAPSSGKPASPSPRLPPTLAILPFVAAKEDSAGTVLADGLVEDLLTRLGRQWFPVIARGSSAQYRATDIDPSAVRRELGADYVVEGSVRRALGKLRITARLIETQTARQTWAQAYDREVEDVFVVQDSLVSTLVAHLGGALLEATCRPLLLREPTDLAAWELALQGSWHFHRRTRRESEEARALLEQAVRRDPMLPLAWYQLAICHQRAIINQWSDRIEGSLRDLRSVCTEFERYFPDDPGLHVASAYALIFDGNRASAMEHLRGAIERDPNSTPAYSLYGQTLSMADRPDEAIEQFEMALRLSPRDSDLWSIHTAIALSHFVAERFEPMLVWAERAVQTRPEMPFPYGTVAVARAFLGDTDGARDAIRRMLSLEPQSSIARVAHVLGSTKKELAARYVAGLRNAGLPD